MPVDAVILNESHRKGGNSYARLSNLLDHAEPLLGGRGYVRNQGNFYFITTSPHDTLLFPEGHSLVKQERYDWAEQPDGSRHGTLKPDPDAAASTLPLNPGGRAVAVAPGVRLGPKPEGDRAA